MKTVSSHISNLITRVVGVEPKRVRVSPKAAAVLLWEMMNMPMMVGGETRMPTLRDALIFGCAVIEDPTLSDFDVTVECVL